VNPGPRAQRSSGLATRPQGQATQRFTKKRKFSNGNGSICCGCVLYTCVKQIWNNQN